MAMTRDGGKPIQRDVMGYKGPTKAINIVDPKSPGLHGDNYECYGTQGQKSISIQTSGAPGIRGENCGNVGTQGKR